MIGRDSVSNHQPHGCLLSLVFRRRSMETSKLHVNGLCAVNSLVTGEFPAQMASNAENFSTWWRHHAVRIRLSRRLAYPEQSQGNRCLDMRGTTVFHCCPIEGIMILGFTNTSGIIVRWGIKSRSYINLIINHSGCDEENLWINLSGRAVRQHPWSLICWEHCLLAFFAKLFHLSDPF